MANYQHIIYLTGDGHVHELYYPLGATGPQWKPNDLTQQTGAPAAATSSGLTSWVDPLNQTPPYQHVIYVTADGHVYELYYPVGATGPRWLKNDLTSVTGAPPADPSSPLTSWLDPVNQHVVYFTSDGQVYELYAGIPADPSTQRQNSGRWQHNDLTASSGAPPADIGFPGVQDSALTSWFDAFNQHVSYVIADGEYVYELYYPLGATGLRWRANGLTFQAPGGGAAAVGNTLTSWVDPANQHVVYVNQKAHVVELYYPLGAAGARWQANDLTAQTGAPIADARSNLGCGLTSWVDSKNQHVADVTDAGEVYELYYPVGVKGSKWQSTPLTKQTGAPLAAVGSALTSWLDAENQHVIYVTGDGHVHELYYPLGATGPRWQTTDVTKQTGAPPAIPSRLTSWADTASAVPVTTAGPNSNSNYLITSNCQPLQDLTVTVQITKDIVCGDGFSFQLNAWSAQGYSTVWQQYVVYLHPDTNEVTYLIDNWVASGGEITNKQWHFYQAQDHKFPAGSTLTIKLTSDQTTGSVTDVIYQMNNVQTTDQPGNTVTASLNLLEDAPRVGGGPLLPSDLAPIVSAQIVLVGFENCAYSAFSSGAGTITYAASNSALLSQFGSQPPCVPLPVLGTCETSNARYGILGGSGAVLTQSFNVA